MSPSKREPLGLDVALFAILLAAAMLALAKYQTSELHEELTAAHAARERAKQDLDGALETIHRLNGESDARPAAAE